MTDMVHQRSAELFIYRPRASRCEQIPACRINHLWKIVEKEEKCSIRRANFDFDFYNS
jgi:hypothetical protein